MAQSFPLEWPTGWPETENRKRSKFQPHTIHQAYSFVLDELRRLGATDIVISTNVPTTSAGVIYSRYRNPDDPGVCAYFQLNGVAQSIPCDKWHRVEDNLWAVGKCIEALRGLERWGAKEMVTASFKGFEQLPNYSTNDTEKSSQNQPEDHFKDCISIEILDLVYKDKVKRMHPDKGGSTDEFIELQRQYKEKKERLKER